LINKSHKIHLDIIKFASFFVEPFVSLKKKKKTVALLLVSYSNSSKPSKKSAKDHIQQQNICMIIHQPQKTKQPTFQVSG